MKNHKLSSTRYNALAGCVDTRSAHTAEEGGNGNLVSRQLEQSLFELAKLKHALELSNQQIQKLTETNASLKQKLIRLAKKSAHARHFCNHDELTGLPNRRLLIDRLKQAIVQSARQHKQVAVLFIDLNKFKSVNDIYGHAAGDKLLQQVAERLSGCLRYGDTACRYGGDEFVIMLPEMEGKESIAAVTEKIRLRLADSYLVDGNAVEVSASIGTTVYRNDGQDCSDLIKQADKAMYLAKAHSVPIRSFEAAIQN